LTEVTFGEWLKRQRNVRGLTREQLAHQIGCAAITLRKIETEERRPSAQIVERLAELFNIPSTERTSFLQFARGDSWSAPTAGVEDIPWRIRTKIPRSNLPTSLTSLIGREGDIARLVEYLSNPKIRLSTLIGPPGIGKTHLSIETAREALSRFADGVFFVPLASLEDSTLLAATVVRTLGFAETGHKPPIQRLKDGIGDKRMLLVLDNLEHIIQDSALLVSELLINCPQLKILATSREALRVPGEWLYPVSVLGVPTTAQLQSLDMEGASQFPALTLFAERACTVRPDFALSVNNVPSVATICAKLDGLPLAIELIAARIRLLSPESLLARLNDELILYADGMRAVSARQKTLHGAISWSYNLLSAEEQKLLAYLSIFAGGFTLSAAESIFSNASTSKTVFDAIASLLDKSLLQRTFGARGEPRFNMLLTVQHFALDRLRRLGEEAEIRRRHLAYFLDLAEQAESHFRGPDQFEWLDRLKVEQDNLRVAWDCALESDAELALRFASALLDFWIMRGNPSEGRGWLAKLLERTTNWGQTAKYAHALGVAGWLAAYQQDRPAAQALLEEALRVARISADKKEIAFALQWIGTTDYFRHDEETAQSFVEERITIYQELRDQWGTAWATAIFGDLDALHGHYAAAEQRYVESLAKFQELGDKYRAARILNMLGELSRIQGDYDRAGKFYEENLEILRGLQIRPAAPTFNLAWVSLHRGDHRKAKILFEESLRLYAEEDDKNGMKNCVWGFAAVLGTTGNPNQAARLFGAAESFQENIGVYMVPPDQKEFDHYVTAVRGQLDEVVFVKAWAEGRAMTLEQAIEYAHEVSIS
jgi:predicted ATPase/DNA-binding XRE family transcriptional regulator